MAFLKLPLETVHESLQYLSLQDLVACRLTCSVLNNLIQNSTQITYNIELELAGVEENALSPAFSNISTAEKLQLLHERERNWLNLMPATDRVPRCVVRSPGADGVAFYVVEDGAMLILNLNRDGLSTRIQYMPAPPPAGQQWTTLFSGKPVLGFTTNGQDLLVVSTCTPLANGEEAQIELHLIQLVHTDVAGGIVAIVYWREDEKIAELHCYDWRSGCALIKPYVCPMDSVIAGFLEDRVLVLASPYSHELIAVRIPFPPGVPPRALNDSMLVIFQLPLLDHRWYVPRDTLQAIGEAGMRAGPRPPGAVPGIADNPPFLVRDRNSLFGITYAVASFANAEDDDDDDRYERLQLVIRRDRLLKLFNLHEPQGGVVCLWRFWGPRAARYLPPAVMTPESSRGGLAGQRRL
ncbi:hypothetical protein MKEN_01022500 [Mycena kentingensis (nom. inval.)]|nr:hypothetical protein MKEN_01022500 [Mycena kentingensis (nom. inval.)]